MNNDILDAVKDCIENPDREQFHGSFVNALAIKDYVRATWHADSHNLMLMGFYIKWCEWYTRDKSDNREELNQALANTLLDNLLSTN